MVFSPKEIQGKQAEKALSVVIIVFVDVG